jgi:hypothetical protein
MMPGAVISLRPSSKEPVTNQSLVIRSPTIGKGGEHKDPEPHPGDVAVRRFHIHGHGHVTTVESVDPKTGQFGTIATQSPRPSSRNSMRGRNENIGL